MAKQPEAHTSSFNQNKNSNNDLNTKLIEIEEDIIKAKNVSMNSTVNRILEDALVKVNSIKK